MSSSSDNSRDSSSNPSRRRASTRVSGASRRGTFQLVRSVVQGRHGAKPDPVHEWRFFRSFRRRSFGERSRTAANRIGEAVTEILATARIDPVLSAEGAVLFLEKVGPALANVDRSSSSVSEALHEAIEELVPLLVEAPAARNLREAWLNRLWKAQTIEEGGRLDSLGEHWGELCGSRELASAWADRLAGGLRMAWGPNPGLKTSFHGATACLSSLLSAERHEELLGILERAPSVRWRFRKFGVRALLALGRKAEALRYAEASRGREDAARPVARACEAILLSSGLADEAYRRYALEANRHSSPAETFQAVTETYPHLPPERILQDLAAALSQEAPDRGLEAATPGELSDLATAFADECLGDMKALVRAVRGFSKENSAFAIELGMAALRWFAGRRSPAAGAWGGEVWVAYQETLLVAESAGRRKEVERRIRALVGKGSTGTEVVARIVGPEPSSSSPKR